VAEARRDTLGDLMPKATRVFAGHAYGRRRTASRFAAVVVLVIVL
jgi:hypothetical protein